MRRLTALALAVGGGLYLSRRRRSETTPRVDVYFDDGSTISLEGAAPGADALVASARRAF
jgi:hypothetical protein